jgi:ABC-2 type transport system ATP-binding protein
MKVRSMTAMIQAEGLVKHYGKLRAVDGLHLAVAPGELYCFLGPNGAGKTTTIKMLIGLLRPDAGSIRVGGLDVWTEPVRAKAMIGYVPDAAQLYDQLTAREFLGFVADIFRLGRNERAHRIDMLLSAFDLTGDADQLIGGFSRGMRQKVVLSAALLHDPQAIFLDEPTVGLDPRSARTLKDLLLATCARGAAVFMSTHILEVAETMADRVGIIQHGKMLYQGSVAGLREYQHGPASASLEELFLALTAPGDQRNA